MGGESTGEVFALEKARTFIGDREGLGGEQDLIDAPLPFRGRGRFENRSARLAERDRGQPLNYCRFARINRGTDDLNGQADRDDAKDRDLSDPRERVPSSEDLDDADGEGGRDGYQEAWSPVAASV